MNRRLKRAIFGRVTIPDHGSDLPYTMDVEVHCELPCDIVSEIVTGQSDARITTNA